MQRKLTHLRQQHQQIVNKQGFKKEKKKKKTRV